MDSLMEEFQDEAKITQMEDREIMSWLEVSPIVRIKWAQMKANLFKQQKWSYVINDYMKH